MVVPCQPGWCEGDVGVSVASRGLFCNICIRGQVSTLAEYNTDHVDEDNAPHGAHDFPDRSTVSIQSDRVLPHGRPGGGEFYGERGSD